MDCNMYQKVSRRFPSRSDRSEAGLYCGTRGWIHFLQQILWICFVFSTKAVIFVRLFPDGKVFAVCCVQSDQRKPTAGLFILHRLLQFTRAVGTPTRGSHNVRVGAKSCTVHATASYTANVNQTKWRDRYDDSDLWLPVRLFPS